MIGRHRLQDGDEAVIGKYTLLFVDTYAEEPAVSLPDLGGTVFLDTEARRELLAQMSKGAPMAPPKAPVPAPPEPAVLRVLSGGRQVRYTRCGDRRR